MSVLQIYFFCLCGLGVSLTNCQVCNPIKCFTLLNSFFQPQTNLDQDSCMKMTQIEQCLLECSAIYNDSSMMKSGITSVTKEICEGDLSDKEIENKCVDKHKYSLLSCLYNSFSLKKENSTSTERLLTCRKVSEAEFCPRNALISCSQNMQYILESLIAQFLKPMKEEVCALYSLDKTWNLKVKPPVDIDDYQKLGKCLDGNKKLITSCIPTKWTATNFVVGQHFGNKQCSGMEAFIDCIRNEIKAKCAEVQKPFDRIGQFLYSYLLPHCSDSSSEYQYADGEEVSVPSTIPEEQLKTPSISFFNSTKTHVSEPENSTMELVVLHQHILYTVVEHRHSSASNMFSVTSTLVLLTVLRLILT